MQPPTPETEAMMEPDARLGSVDGMITFIDKMFVDAKSSSSVNSTAVEVFRDSQEESKLRDSDRFILLDSREPLEFGQPTVKPEYRRTQADAKKTYDCNVVPYVRNVAKLREHIRLALIRLRLEMKERREPFKPLSAKGRLSHYYIEPLWNWWGKNDRVLLTQPLSKVDIQEVNGDSSSVVNGASQNYAGFNKATPESEELQRLCLDTLPVADSVAAPSLETALHLAIAEFFNTDFACTSATGYGSNLLTLPALLDSDWLIILDRRSHSSMYTGSLLAFTGCIRKFDQNNISNLEGILQELAGQFKNVLVAIEGINCMDGTTPPLDQIHQLKQRYRFSLYCDEAHSFMSIGKTGRGCLEFWNDEHPDACLPQDLIDIRTATLSKAVGGVGGLVCASDRFKEVICQRVKLVNGRGDEPLTTSTIVQTIYVLGQPARLKRHLHRLRQISQFCRKELKRYGIHVYGNALTLFLPIHTGRPSWAAKMSYVLRQLGLLATPVCTPAVTFWGSRVHICLSADHCDDEVNKLLDCVIEAAKSIGIIRAVNIPRMPFEYEYPCMADINEEDLEASASAKRIRELILRDAAGLQDRMRPSQRIFDMNCGATVLESGHSARKLYGLGSGGSRWVLGAFRSHLEVENLITEVMQMDAAMTFPDAELGLCTTVAALCRELIRYPKHYFFIPKIAPAAVLEGLQIAHKDDGSTKFVEYANVAELFLLITVLYERKVYITLYMDTIIDSVPLDFEDVILQLTRGKGPRWGMTLLLNDFDGLGRHSPYPLGVAAAHDLQKIAKMLDIRLLVCGSFRRAFGLSGGYVTGDKVLIQELRFTNRAYMFTTSPQPFIMEMIRTALQKLLSFKEESAKACVQTPPQKSPLDDEIAAVVT